MGGSRQHPCSLFGVGGFASESSHPETGMEAFEKKYSYQTGTYCTTYCGAGIDGNEDTENGHVDTGEGGELEIRTDICAPLCVK